MRKPSCAPVIEHEGEGFDALFVPLSVIHPSEIVLLWGKFSDLRYLSSLGAEWLLWRPEVEAAPDTTWQGVDFLPTIAGSG